MPTRYFYDTEFLEDGRTIELISIGIVADDGREYYAVNRDFRWRRIAHRRLYAPWLWKIREPWLLDNVVSSLPELHGDARLRATAAPFGAIDWRDRRYLPVERIANQVAAFLLAGDSTPELWADYCAYDHVVLCQLWGRMIDLPGCVPMFTHDFQHELDRLGRPAIPEQAAGLHNALADARHLRDCFASVTVTS